MEGCQSTFTKRGPQIEGVYSNLFVHGLVLIKGDIHEYEFLRKKPCNKEFIDNATEVEKL